METQRKAEKRTTRTHEAEVRLLLDHRQPGVAAGRVAGRDSDDQLAVVGEGAGAVAHPVAPQVGDCDRNGQRQYHGERRRKAAKGGERQCRNERSSSAAGRRRQPRNRQSQRKASEMQAKCSEKTTGCCTLKAKQSALSSERHCFWNKNADGRAGCCTALTGLDLIDGGHHRLGRPDLCATKEMRCR